MREPRLSEAQSALAALGVLRLYRSEKAKAQDEGARRCCDRALNPYLRTDGIG